MGAPIPQFIPEAFAISAAPGDRNTIPAAPVTAQRASFDLGFPPLVMLPILAGGKPMLGPDMNGILYMISSHTVYAQSGQPYQYSAPVAASIAGYAAGTILGSPDGTIVWYNLTPNNSTDPDAGGAGWTALYAYGIANVSGLIGGVDPVTSVEATKGIILLTGALVANQQVVMPNLIRSWLIVNSCTGGFTVTVKTAAGTGVVVPAGGFASPTEVYSDAVNVYPTFVPAALPIDVAPTPNTIPLRDNTGRVLSVTPVLGDNTTYVATSEYVQDAMLGSASQSYSANLYGATRLLATNYVNTTKRPIFVAIWASGFNDGIQATVDGQIAGTISWPAALFNSTLSFIVPPGATYRVDVTHGVAPNMNSWNELS